MIDLSANNGAVKVAPTQLTFTPSNWNTPQQATVTGVDDSVVQGDHTTVITAAVNDAASSNDFDNADNKTLTVTLKDDDKAGIAVEPQVISSLEAGEAATTTVKLTSQPTSNVVINLTSSNPNVTLNPTTLTFTPANWNVPQTVSATAIHDDNSTGETVTATLAIVDAQSASEYQSVADASFRINVVDDDKPGLVVSPREMTLDENGGTGTISVQLATQPTAGNVVLNLSSSDTTEATLSPATLTFTTTNWNQPQIVTVTGVNDDIDRNDNVNLSVKVTVNDPNSSSEYDTVADETVKVTIIDDDTAGVTVAPLTLATDEGASTTNTIKLDTQPTGNVTIKISSTKPEKVGIAPATLTFTPTNWNQPQTITYSGKQDADALDEQDVITYSVDASSPAVEYQTVPEQTANISVTDDDEADMIVTPTTLSMNENGGTGTFTATLTAQPITTIRFLVESANSSIKVDKPTLTFTPDNWDQPQTVTVTGVDDQIAQGNHASLVKISSDPTQTGELYSEMIPKEVDVTLTDNDKAGMQLSGDTLHVNEGESGTITAQLSSQPTGTVVVDVALPANAGGSAHLYARQLEPAANADHQHSKRCQYG